MLKVRQILGNLYHHLHTAVNSKMCAQIHRKECCRQKLAVLVLLGKPENGKISGYVSANGNCQTRRGQPQMAFIQRREQQLL